MVPVGVYDADDVDFRGDEEFLFAFSADLLICAFCEDLVIFQAIGAEGFLHPASAFGQGVSRAFCTVSLPVLSALNTVRPQGA